MINRTLIRTKVLQILYAFYQKGTKELKLAENELNCSLLKTHCLYHYLLLIIIKLTDREKKILDTLTHNNFLSQKKLNRKFADNLLVEKLQNHSEFIQYTNKYNWIENNNESYFIKSLLNEIKQSNCYLKYISIKNTYNNDYEFWKAIFEQIILKSSTVSEWLEQKNIYWNDDLETIAIFVLKTLKQFQYKITSKITLFTIFRNNTAQEKFAMQLLHSSIKESNKNYSLISTHMKNWDRKHIAILDLIIMQMALAEISNFPSIPLKVTLNEYIDLARYYSTPKSTFFINGILQAIVSSLDINKI